MYTIYYIKNRITNEYYVGQTNNFEERIITHKKASRSLHPKTRLAYSLNKYGENNFDYEIITTVENKEEAAELEKYYISKFNSYLCGYNMTTGGEFNQTGKLVSDETRLKISEGTKKGMDNKELKEHLSAFWKEYYKTHSPANKGVPMSEEAKAKISKAKKGVPIVFHKSKEELFEKRSAAAKRNNADRHWFTNGVEDVRILSSQIPEYLDKGYVKGRTQANGKNKKHNKKCQNMI